MYYLYIDGGSSNNQDAAKRVGYGSFYVTTTPYPDHERGMIKVERLEFGNVTNNQAEYKTLLEALDYCVNEFMANPIIVTDSKLMVEQLQGRYKTKDAILKEFKEQAEKDIQLIGAKLIKAPREVLVGVLGH